ncbi:hypothetical protein GCM10012286_01680 [Streptomyces lasiicapitis]|uniref:Uncharacterized protein n=1 Tax=Streptomyces lasiicapitis TaxID=1923961 RepID=A0ABQ2LIS0_9ACTN|nr:hypothetical protein GCM10012286_01680 [Streptomyces lasiicapitis]
MASQHDFAVRAFAPVENHGGIGSVRGVHLPIFLSSGMGVETTERVVLRDAEEWCGVAVGSCESRLTWRRS